MSKDSQARRIEVSSFKMSPSGLVVVAVVGDDDFEDVFSAFPHPGEDNCWQ